MVPTLRAATGRWLASHHVVFREADDAEPRHAFDQAGLGGHIGVVSENGK
jgi:hypothetical protein